jgi:DNA-binding FrmR family transcriptional regulator
VQPRKPALLRRISRIEGQVRGVGAMIAADRYCIDVLTQLSAARAALDAVAMELIADHARHCVRHAVAAGQGAAAIDELLAVVRRLAR